jgi:hypothetical protein
MQTQLTHKQTTQVSEAKSLCELAVIAKKTIKKAKKKYLKAIVLQVCGPITSGGKGNRDANLIEFNKAVTALASLPYLIFNQMPYEDKIGSLMSDIIKKTKSKFAYGMDVLIDFYETIFEKQYTDILIFLPGWEASIGACWEYKKGKKFGIKTRQLKDNWVKLIAKGETDIKKLTIKI